MTVRNHPIKNIKLRKKKFIVHIWDPPHNKKTRWLRFCAWLQRNNDYGSNPQIAQNLLTVNARELCCLT